MLSAKDVFSFVYLSTDFSIYNLSGKGHRKKKLKKKKKKYDVSGILHEGPKWIPGKGSPGRWG